MTLAALVATIVFPILPWIATAPFFLAKAGGKGGLWVLFSAGLLLDLWWGKPLGLTPLVLLSVLALTIFIGRIWPTNIKVWLALSLLVSFIATELYLVFL